MANVGRITRRTMGAAVAALLGAAVPAGAASAHPGAPWHHRFHGVAGTVSAVNGSSTPGSCGTAGSAGSFTVTKHQASDTVDVATTTAFFERGVSSPSFANVCVGDLAGAIGMLSGTTLDANDVFVAPPPTPPSTESAPSPDTWQGPAKQASVHTDSATLPHPGTPRPDNGQWSGTGRGLSQGRDTWRQGLSASHAWGGSNGRPWGGSNGDHGRR